MRRRLTQLDLALGAAAGFMVIALVALVFMLRDTMDTVGRGDDAKSPKPMSYDFRSSPLDKMSRD